MRSRCLKSLERPSISALTNLIEERNKVDVIDTTLPGVQLIIPRRFSDNRGFFAETYNQRAYADLGISDIFVQDNHSVSEQAGTLRGLHFQNSPHAQGKLVRCGRGSIFDVAVDIRRDSPTFGSSVGYELTAENGHQLYIPQGFAHGFQTLKSDSEIVYKCTQYYAPEAEGALRWDDPDIKINWPLKNIIALSEKDMSAPFLASLGSLFTWDGAK